MYKKPIKPYNFDLISSSRDCQSTISLHLRLSSAECGKPCVYQAMCFRISLTAVYSPLYSISILACFKTISRTSVEDGSSTIIPFSRYSFICLKIHGFPLALFQPLTRHIRYILSLPLHLLQKKYHRYQLQEFSQPFLPL